MAALLVVAVLVGHLQRTSQDVAWGAGQVDLYSGPDLVTGSMPARPGPGWRTLPPNAIGTLDNITWIGMDVDLPAGEGPVPPYALFLGGPFSAEVYWDGTLLGSKGTVGAHAGQEQPGPIDSVFYISEAQSSPGAHELLLRISSASVGYQAQSLFHDLFVGSYRNDPRRQLRFYALPLILSGCLVVFGFYFGRVCYSSGSRSTLLLSAFSTLLLVQMVFEVSRSLVAYPYDWHVYRSVGIWLCALGSGLVLVRLVQHRTGLGGHRLLVITALLALAASYGVSGFDNKAVAALFICSVPMVGLGLRHWRQSKPDLLVVSAALLGLAWLCSGLASATAFLDSSVYASSVVFLGMAWVWTAQGNESLQAQGGDQTVATHILVRHTGKTERIPVDSVVAIAAAGNFAELLCEDGRTVLHHLRLGQLMEQPPVRFVRVHRSWAVNLDKVVALTNREGSRYSLEMSDGSEIPVSRYQVAEVRRMLAA